MPAFVYLLIGVLAPVLARGVDVLQETPPSRQQNDTPFVLGVLRSDGVVLPFASFDGKKWDSRWPDKVRNVEVPLTLDDVADKWWGKAGAPKYLTVWSEGRAQGTIKLERPVVVSTACMRQIGVTSNYHPGEIPPPPFIRPYPKDGLVISGLQPIYAIGAVPGQSPEIKAAVAVIRENATAAEDRAIAAFTDWDHPLTKGGRLQIPLEIEALYRAPMDAEGWSMYHVEAVKRYPPGYQDEGCGVVTSFTGWVGLGPQGKPWVQLAARITYCDRRGVSYFLPLGLLRLRGRIYWVFQASGYEHERYFVVRPTKSEIIVESLFTAGSCDGF